MLSALITASARAPHIRMFDVLGNHSAVSPFTVTPEITDLIFDSIITHSYFKKEWNPNPCNQE